MSQCDQGLTRYLCSVSYHMYHVQYRGTVSNTLSACFRYSVNHTVSQCLHYLLAQVSL